MKTLNLYTTRGFFLRSLLLGALLLGHSWGLQAATITWTNRLGGNWQTANNWSPHQVPTSNDTVLITLNANLTVTLSADASAGSLDLSAPTGMSSG